MDRFLDPCPQFRYLLCILLVVSCGVIIGCRPSPQCRSFYELVPKEREARIREASEKDQIDLYFCGMYQEPPTDYSNIIADRGAAVIPALLEKLKTLESDTQKDFILHIFEQIAERGYLHGNRDVLEQLRNVVHAMTNDRRRDLSQRRLAVIEGRM